jgi:hypothetical protein
MAPPAIATARRAPTRSAPRGYPSAPRRPPLQVFEPTRRRRPDPRVRRSTIWLSGLLIVGSLLAVVVGDALVTEGQVRLSDVQAQVASAVAAGKSLQVSVAGKAAPPVVVGQAEAEGLVAPTQVVYLPQVPLDVPLPVPQTTPASAPAGASPPSSSGPAPASPSAAPVPTSR